MAGRQFLEESLGKDCFSDSGKYVGHFWKLLSTRPYMRVLQAQVRLYFEAEDYGRSACVSHLVLSLI
jgi:hypothetical protein